jgi:Gas vesicle protein
MSVHDPRDPRWQGTSETTLVDLVDRVLAGGVVLAGDITLSIADVDLVHISLRALVSSVETLMTGSPELEDLARRDAG